MKKRIIAVCMAVLSAVAFAQNTASEFAIDANGVITKYEGWAFEVVIPESVNGIRVTAIGGGAFSGKDLTRVTIPQGVITIGARAFRDNKLVSVTIPNSVTSIGDHAFYKNRLTSVTLGNNITTIGNLAFAYNQLASIIIPDSVTSLGDSAFKENQLTKITIGKGITRIRIYTFENNKQLKNVNIPASVTSIGDRAFGDCNDLTLITFEKGNVISADNFNEDAFPQGKDLRRKYFAYGAGHYGRPAKSPVWTKWND